MKNKLFEGIATALVTPFNSNNEIDFLCLKELIDFQIKNGISAIVLAGTTGEAPALSFDEYSALIAYGNEYIDKRVPLIAGSGSNNTDTAIKYSLEAQKRGANALLVVTPYYNKTTQEGILNYYKTIASYVTVPIIVYNVPSRTGLDINSKTYTEISSIRLISGVKEASNEIHNYYDKFYGKDLAIYCGNDNLFLPYLSLGADGIISVVSNIFPQKMKEIYDSFTAGDTKRALRIYQSIAQIIQILTKETNPIPIKKALSLFGFKAGDPRPPLMPCTRETEHLL